MLRNWNEMAQTAMVGMEREACTVPYASTLRSTSSTKVRYGYS
jgi:hypothetical protein